MRTLGLIGGMSWESTAIYYRHLNEIARERLGGLHSARLVLWSVDFAEIAELQHAGDWAAAGRILADAARKLEAAGAEALVLCTNTMHLLTPTLEAAVGIPLLHIADATGAALAGARRKRPLLLATRFTMEQAFYRDRLWERHGQAAMIPEEEADRAMIHDIIYNELCRGVVRQESRRAYLDIIDRLRDQGADSVILGCTEIAMLIGPGDLDLPMFDTTRLHAEAAVRFIIDESP